MYTRNFSKIVANHHSIYTGLNHSSMLDSNSGCQSTGSSRRLANRSFTPQSFKQFTSTKNVTGLKKANINPTPVKSLTNQEKSDIFKYALVKLCLSPQNLVKTPAQPSVALKTSTSKNFTVKNDPSRKKIPKNTRKKRLQKYRLKNSAKSLATNHFNLRVRTVSTSSSAGTSGYFSDIDKISESSEELCHVKPPSNYLNLPQKPKNLVSPILYRSLYFQNLPEKLNRDFINLKNYEKSLKTYAIGCGFSKTDNPAAIITPTNNCLHPKTAPCVNYGEDAVYLYETDSFLCYGISDGVGGWRSHGVDAAKFSFELLKNVQNLYKLNENMKILLEKSAISNNPIKKSQNTTQNMLKNPIQVLSRAYNQLTAIPDIIGSATATLLAIDKLDKKLYACNLGDSGILVIRHGEIIYQSQPQVHNFNSPYQLSIIPIKSAKSSGSSKSHKMERKYCDLPQKSEFKQVDLQAGDLILTATDGLFDNVHLQHLLQLLKLMKIDENLLKLKNQKLINAKLEKATTSLVAFARQNAFNSNYVSPFSIEAGKYGYDVTGGKIDDISLVLTLVGE